MMRTNVRILGLNKLMNNCCPSRGHIMLLAVTTPSALLKSIGHRQLGNRILLLALSVAQDPVGDVDQFESSDRTT